jgi:leucyl aminopeptidase (aminopeptidase T)
MPRARLVRPEEALARAVLDRALALRRGQRLTVVAWNHALPWARAILIAAQRAGVRPLLVLEDEEAFFGALAAVGARQLHVPTLGSLPEADALVYLDGPESFPRLLGLPAADRDRVARARRTAAAGRLRSLRLRIADATPTAAERFGVDLARWQSELVRASSIDPVRLAGSGRRVSRRLRPGRWLHLRHDNGTDLNVRLASGAPAIDLGLARPGTVAELPSGLWRARVAPGTADGTFETNRATYDRFADDPSALHGRLEIHQGRIRAYEGDRSAQAFAAFVRTGRGRVQARSVAIGLNPEIRSAPEVLELAAGTVTLVVGDPPAGARGLRWPRFVLHASLAGADVEVDGRPWMANGVLPPSGARSERPTRRGSRLTR